MTEPPARPWVLSLRARITLALVSLAVVPLALATFLLARQLDERLERSTREYSLAVSDQVLLGVTGLLAKAREELGGTGAALADPAASPDDRLRAARARLLGAQLVRTVSLFDREGAFVDTVYAAPLPPAISRPPTLDAGLRREAEERGLLVGEPVFDPATRSPYLPLVAPVFRSGGLLYAYVWTAIALSPLSQEVAQTSRRRFGEAASNRIFVFDARLRILAHGDLSLLGSSFRERGFLADLADPAATLGHGAAYVASYVVDGSPLVGVLVPFPELRWGVVVEQPEAEAYQEVRAAVGRALLVGLAFVLVAIGFGLFLGGRLAAPVLAVSQAARRVAAGAFDVRVTVPRRDEVGQLADAFNSMAADLQRYEQRLVAETQVRTNLSRYLSAELVEAILAGKQDLRLGGERGEVTVIFADVVAFTRLAQEHPPEQVVAVLNELFTFLTEIVFRHGGIVDKFVGDCVMAVFGAPYPQPDHALRAARAAEEMLCWLDSGNAKWRKELGSPLQLGIGVGSGEVVEGNIGSEKRMEYTVIGDAVNLAARLEHLARPGQVLLSRATAAAIGAEFEVRSLGEHPVGGRARPVEIFELVL